MAGCSLTQFPQFIQELLAAPVPLYLHLPCGLGAFLSQPVQSSLQVTGRRHHLFMPRLNNGPGFPRSPFRLFQVNHSLFAKSGLRGLVLLFQLLPLCGSAPRIM